MSKVEREVYFVDILSDDRQIKYQLTKPNDPAFLKKAEKIKWIKFKEDGTFKETIPQAEVGTSLILEPQWGAMFIWQTTSVTEIVEKTDDYILFRTKNSLYKLEKL